MFALFLLAFSDLGGCLTYSSFIVAISVAIYDIYFFSAAYWVYLSLEELVMLFCVVAIYNGLSVSYMLVVCVVHVVAA